MFDSSLVMLLAPDACCHYIGPNRFAGTFQANARLAGAALLSKASVISHGL